MKTKILITVEGGLIQSVCSNNMDIKVMIADYDRGDEGETPVYEENVTLLDIDNFCNPTPMEAEVRDELKAIHFFD